jgi:hypothetical protein
MAPTVPELPTVREQGARRRKRQIESFALSPDGRKVAFYGGLAYAAVGAIRFLLNGRSREVNPSHTNDELRRTVDTGVAGAARVPLSGTAWKSRRSSLSAQLQTTTLSSACGERTGPHSYHPGSRAWIELQSLAAVGYGRRSRTRGAVRRTGRRSARSSRLGRRDFEDIMAGVDELVARGVADPERFTLAATPTAGL